MSAKNLRANRNLLKIKTFLSAGQGIIPETDCGIIARAITVAKFLIKNGVTPHRVSIQGFSRYRPLFENISPENRQKNRRVEITLIKEQDRG